MVISFGIEKGAKIWLEETKCIFPMFLDHERTFYESFGLQRSIEKVWFGTSNLLNRFCYFTRK